MIAQKTCFFSRHVKSCGEIDKPFRSRSGVFDKRCRDLDESRV